MQRRGLEPNTLIRACEKGEQPEKALQLLEQMQRRGLDPDSIIPRGCSLSSLPTFDRYRTRVYEIEGDGVSHLSCTSDRYNIIIYPITTPCMCSPIEAMSTGRSLGTFPVAVLQRAAVPVRRASSQARPQSSLRGCCGEAWNPTGSSVPVRRGSSQKRPCSSLRRCNEEAWPCRQVEAWERFPLQQ